MITNHPKRPFNAFSLHLQINLILSLFEACYGSLHDTTKSYSNYLL